MYRAAEFREFMRSTKKLADNTINTGSSNIKRIDGLIGGLDEKLNAEGADAVLSWAQTESQAPFSNNNASQARSFLKSYIEFDNRFGEASDVQVELEKEQASGTV